MFKFGKNRRSNRKNKLSSRSLPVTRYYKPSNVSKKKPARKTGADLGAGSMLNKAKATLSNLLQKILIITIIALILINTTMSSVVVKIQESEDSHSYRSLSEYNDVVTSVFSESLFNRSKLTLDSSKFESSIKDVLPEVIEVTAVIPLAGRKLQVGIKTDDPLIRLRRQTDQQGIVGKSGKLLLLTDTNLVLEGFSALPSLEVMPNVNFDRGSQVLTTSETVLISLLISEFDGSEPYRNKISSIVFDVEKRELQVMFNNVSFFAKLTPERGAREQVGSLLATLKQLAEQGAMPSKYVDVRVDGRAFVK